jgi:hypothetical protein
MHRHGNLDNPAPGAYTWGNGLIDQLADPRIRHMADPRFDQLADAQGRRVW